MRAGYLLQALGNSREAKAMLTGAAEELELLELELLGMIALPCSASPVSSSNTSVTDLSKFARAVLAFLFFGQIF